MTRPLLCTFMVATLCGCTMPSRTADPQATRPPASEVHVDEIGRNILILGRLGVPVGQEVVIEGRKDRNLYTNWLWVDKVDGKRLDGVRGILVDGIGEWKNGTRVVLKGHEYGSIRFLQFWDTQLPMDALAAFCPHQHIFLSFRVTEVVSPKHLTPAGD